MNKKLIIAMMAVSVFLMSGCSERDNESSSSQPSSSLPEVSSLVPPVSSSEVEINNSSSVPPSSVAPPVSSVAPVVKPPTTTVTPPPTTTVTPSSSKAPSSSSAPSITPTASSTLIKKEGTYKDRSVENLTITSDVDEYDDIILEDVKVSGTLTINGGGHITLIDCDIDEIEVDHRYAVVDIYAEGDTEVGKLRIKTDVLIDESDLDSDAEGFRSIYTYERSGYDSVDVEVIDAELDSAYLYTRTYLTDDGEDYIDRIINEKYLYDDYDDDDDDDDDRDDDDDYDLIIKSSVRYSDRNYDIIGVDARSRAINIDFNNVEVEDTLELYGDEDINIEADDDSEFDEVVLDGRDGDMNVTLDGLDIDTLVIKDDDNDDANFVIEGTGGTKVRNLQISSSVEDGDVTIEGIEVTGTVTISGGGANSVDFRDMEVGAITVNKSISGSDEIPTINLRNVDIDNNTITLANSATLKAQSMDKVNVNVTGGTSGKKTTIDIPLGTLTVSTNKADVQLEGKADKVNLTTSGSKITLATGSDVTALSASNGANVITSSGSNIGTLTLAGSNNNIDVYGGNVTSIVGSGSGTIDVTSATVGDINATGITTITVNHQSAKIAKLTTTNSPTVNLNAGAITTLTVNNGGKFNIAGNQSTVGTASVNGNAVPTITLSNSGEINTLNLNKQANVNLSGDNTNIELLNVASSIQTASQINLTTQAEIGTLTINSPVNLVSDNAVVDVVNVNAGIGVKPNFTFKNGGSAKLVSTMNVNSNIGLTGKEFVANMTIANGVIVTDASGATINPNDTVVRDVNALKKALNEASDNQKITIASGTYDVGASPASISSATGVQLVPETNNVTITATGATALELTNGANVTIIGITINKDIRLISSTATINSSTVTGSVILEGEQTNKSVLNVGDSTNLTNAKPIYSLNHKINAQGEMDVTVDTATVTGGSFKQGWVDNGSKYEYVWATNLPAGAITGESLVTNNLSSADINTKITNAPAGSTLYFEGGDYNLNAPLIVNKNITIAPLGAVSPSFNQPINITGGIVNLTGINITSVNDVSISNATVTLTDSSFTGSIKLSKANVTVTNGNSFAEKAFYSADNKLSGNVIKPSNAATSTVITSTRGNTALGGWLLVDNAYQYVWAVDGVLPANTISENEVIPANATIDVINSKIANSTLVYFEGGTYTFNSTLQISAKANLTIEKLPTSNDVIFTVPTNYATSAGNAVVKVLGSTDVKINNITIDGYKNTQNNVVQGAAYGIEANNSTVTLNNVVIRNNKNAAVYSYDAKVTATGLTTSGNTIGAVQLDGAGRAAAENTFTLNAPTSGANSLGEGIAFYSITHRMGGANKVTVIASEYTVAHGWLDILSPTPANYYVWAKTAPTTVAGTKTFTDNTTANLLTKPNP